MARTKSKDRVTILGLDVPATKEHESILIAGISLGEFGRIEKMGRIEFIDTTFLGWFNRVVREFRMPADDFFDALSVGRLKLPWTGFRK